MLCLSRKLGEKLILIAEKDIKAGSIIEVHLPDKQKHGIRQAIIGVVADDFQVWREEALKKQEAKIRGGSGKSIF